MRFFSVSAALAFAASAVAQTPDFDPIFTPKDGAEVAAGSTFEVTWEAPAKYKDETVSISLIGGADQGTLVPIAEIAGGIANAQESYQWSVDASLGAEATYGLVFKLESNPEIFQYSFPFKIAKGKGDGPSDEPEEPSKPTHIVTTAHGIKTVTLTSCPPESTSTPPPPPPPVTSTWIAPNTTSTWATSTKVWNTTTSSIINTPLPPPATTVINTPVPLPTVPAEEPSTTPSQIPEAGASKFIAGPVALVAGLAMALVL